MIIDTCINPWLTKHLFGNIEKAVAERDSRLIPIPDRISMKPPQFLLFLQV